MTVRGGLRPAPAWFLLLALLYLAPVWSVGYIPTTDGPSHTYNAWILQRLVAGDAFLARTYEVDWRPHPNWLGHALMAAAMTIVPPLVAEKLLVSLILIGFFAGLWMLGGPTFSFLGLPLSYHLLFQNGFYNYSLGVGLYAIVLALWWRRREALLMHALLLAALYFAHIVPAAMAFASILVSWMLTDRRPRLLLPLIPIAVLFGWFALHPILRGERWTWEGAFLVWPLWRLPLVMTFDVRQLWLGTLLGVLYGALLVYAIVRRRGIDPLLILVLLCVIVFLAAPLDRGEGLILKARFLIFPFLCALLVFSGMDVSLRLRAVLVVVLSLVSAANAIWLLGRWREADRQIARFLHPLQQIPPRSTLLPLLFDRTLGGPLPLRSHVVDYAAIERKLIDYDNYQAAAGYFPVRFRDEVRRPAIFDIEAQPGSVRFAEADFIYTSHAPADWQPPNGYRQVAEDGDARLYRR